MNPKKCRITQITDQQGRIDRLSYNTSSADIVTERIAPDGCVTDYAFSYDSTNLQFDSTITGPQTAAGRRVQDYTPTTALES